jgi:hypothetical protein
MQIRKQFMNFTRTLSMIRFKKYISLKLAIEIGRQYGLTSSTLFTSLNNKNERQSFALCDQRPMTESDVKQIIDIWIFNALSVFPGSI